MQDTFNNVIIQSAPMAIPFRKFTEAMTIYLDFAQLLNCAARDVACLRSKSVNDILEAQFAVEKKITSLKLLEFFEPWLPWLDGNLVKGQLLELNKWNLATKYAYKPFIIGTLSEECYIYIYSAFTKPITTQFYLEIVTAAFKQHVIDTVKNFPPDFSKTDQRDLTSVLATDWVFACGSRNFLEQIYKSPASKGNNYFMNVFDYAVDFPGNLT
jgi:carboxylesterase type B